MRRSHRTTRPTARRARKTFLVASALVAVLVAGASSLSIASIHHVERTIHKLKVGSQAGCVRDCLPDVTPECVQNVCDFLILGSDTRQGLSKKEQSAFGSTTTSPGQRADTIILVRIDPVRERTIVLSIPRDLRVEIPGHGMDKINTAFGYGPNVIVRVVERLTGLPINHYVQVNFVGFERLVDALGGVPICINRPLIDQLAGLNLPNKGCYNLRGSQALAFVRARHIEGDIIPDFSRIARQQQFTRAVIQKSLSAGAILHLPSLIRAVQKNFVYDDHLSLYSLQDLTRKLADTGQRGVDFRVVPSTPITIGDEDFVRLIQPNATKLFRRIRNGRDLGNIGRESLGTPVSPANVTVQVYDAGSGGQAQEVVSFLQRAGFVVLPVRDAPPGLARSEMLWSERRLDEARSVMSYLTSTLPLERNDSAVGSADAAVVIGPDFQGIEGT